LGWIRILRWLWPEIVVVAFLPSERADHKEIIVQGSDMNPSSKLRLRRRRKITPTGYSRRLTVLLQPSLMPG